MTQNKTNNFSILKKFLKENPRLGILSGCSKNGKKLLKIKMKYFWYIHNNTNTEEKFY